MKDDPIDSPEYWGKVFENHCEKIRNSQQFVVRPVMYKGEIVDTFGGDERILRILNFKATGITISFEKAQLEYAEYADNWMENQWNRIPQPNRKWFDEFIMERNYRLLFKDGDISIRKKKGEIGS